MKLRTELTPRPNGKVGHGLAFNEDGDREHDAAAAHALMMAMEDLNHSGWTKHQNPVHAAKCRADELMRQWGFTDG